MQLNPILDNIMTIFTKKREKILVGKGGWLAYQFILSSTILLLLNPYMILI